MHVPLEDLGVEAEGDDALLDAGPAGVVDAHHRAAGLERVVHDLDDLLAEDLAQRPAEHREVLREDRHRAAVDRAVPGHHAVAVRALALQAEARGPVPGQRVELHEAVGVQERQDAFPGGHLALGVLLLHRAGGSGVRGLVQAALQVGEFPRRRVDVDLGVYGLSHGLSAHWSLTTPHSLRGPLVPRDPLRSLRRARSGS
nr:hypothetical protein GCM10020093_091600 [Planobispora longispora]